MIATDEAMLDEVGSVGGHPRGGEGDGSVAYTNLDYGCRAYFRKSFDKKEEAVKAPHGRFRIALAFPDVGMGQFMRISSLPDVIIETLSAVAGAERTSSGGAWQ